MRKKEKRNISKMLEITSLKQIFLGILISAGIIFLSNSFTSLIKISLEDCWSGVYWIIVFSILTLFVNFSIIKYQPRELSWGFLIGIGTTLLTKLVSLFNII